MKKILVLHTNYRDIGGEDIAVKNEVELLKKFYEVKTVYFSNNISNYFKQSISFIFNNDKKSVEILKNELQQFNPDIVYVHNTWFKASLGIFKLLEKQNVKTILTLGKIAFDSCLKFFQINKSKAKFIHGAEYLTNTNKRIVACYHPSPRNVNTNRINEKGMVDLLRKIHNLHK